MSRPRRPVPPPLEGNDQIVAGAGAAGWAVALVILLLLRHHLPASSRFWIWTCVVGLGLGLFALGYVPRLKRSRIRAAERGEAAHR